MVIILTVAIIADVAREASVVRAVVVHRLQAFWLKTKTEPERAAMQPLAAGRGHGQSLDQRLRVLIAVGSFSSADRRAQMKRVNALSLEPAQSTLAPVETTGPPWARVRSGSKKCSTRPLELPTAKKKADSQRGVSSGDQGAIATSSSGADADVPAGSCEGQTCSWAHVRRKVVTWKIRLGSALGVRTTAAARERARIR